MIAELNQETIQEQTLSNPNEIADKICKDNILFHCAGRFYKYREGVYEKIENSFLLKQVKTILKDKFQVAKGNDILKTIEIEADIGNPDKLVMNLCPNLINLKNGMLDLTDFSLREHDPIYQSITQINASYNKDADCKKWIKTLLEIFPDCPEKIDLLQEFFGLCLTRDTKYEKALWLLGEGANGKSTILYVLQQILDRANYTSIPLEKFNDFHYTANLFGKMANISIETNAKSAVYDALFKAIVSGDTISADMKYGQVFQFSPYCKLIFALNNMPRVDDKTGAFYRRLIILKLPREFKEEEQNKNLKNELLAEKDGILNWMINGLKRLQARGYFEITGKVKEEVEEYRAENNNVLVFVKEECVLENEAEISKQGLYDAYAQWCKTNGYRGLSKKRFGTEILKHFTSIEEAWAKPEGRVWRGINTTFQPAEKWI
jgi:putative DNA primase/helicase